MLTGGCSRDLTGSHKTLREFEKATKYALLGRGPPPKGSPNECIPCETQAFWGCGQNTKVPKAHAKGGQNRCILQCKSTIWGRGAYPEGPHNPPHGRPWVHGQQLCLRKTSGTLTGSLRENQGRGLGVMRRGFWEKSRAGGYRASP